MRVEYFDNFDVLRDKIDIEVTQESIRSMLEKLDGQSQVYLCIEMADEQSLLVVGNGSRFVVNHESCGIVRWLNDVSAGDDLVEIVKGDPNRTFKLSTTVSLTQATQSIGQLLGLCGSDTNCTWE